MFILIGRLFFNICMIVCMIIIFYMYDCVQIFTCTFSFSRQRTCCPTRRSSQAGWTEEEVGSGNDLVFSPMLYCYEYLP